jgi:hypothetical protein
LIFALAACAQQPAAPAAPVAAPVLGGIKVLVLEGQNASNSTKRQVAVQPVVEVRDANDRPIEGATVVFRLPPNGAGGFFPGQKLTLSVKTNVQGQAGATGFAPNDRLGSFEIHVTATNGNRIGEAVVKQRNTVAELSSANGPANPKKPLWRNKYVLGGAAGLVVVAVIVAVTTGGKAKNPTVTINPGPVTVNQ